MTINQSVLCQVIPQIEWVQNYSERDQIINIPSAIDANDNVYITGYTYAGNTRNFTTIKYDPNGNLLWVQNYSGIPGGDDRSHAIKLDNQGNVYVAGESQGNGTQKDFAVVKYDANGNQLWDARYNGAANGNDYAYALELDNQNNAYITGKSMGNSGDFNVVTVKYNANGTEQWTNTYTANADNEGIDVVKGNGNRVFVLVASQGGNAETHVLRMNANNGNTAGTAVLSNVGEDYTPYKFTLNGNNVVVTGSKTGAPVGMDYFTTSINGNNANINWSATYNAYNGNDFATDIYADSNGDIFVTGVADNNGILEYHTVKYDNGNQIWVNKESTNFSFLQAHPSIEGDDFDHLYVCGERMQGTVDVLIYQITPGGNTSWTKTHNGGQNGMDAGVDLVYGGNGDLYVAAQTQNSNARFDYTTIKISQYPVYFPIDINNEEPNNLHAYFENKGQLLKTNGSSAEEVLYSANNPGHETFILRDRFSYVYSEIDTLDSNNRSQLQRVDVEFPGHDLSSQPAHFEAIDFKKNYYLPHCGPGGITNVSGYHRLLFPEFYKDVDLHIFNNDFGIKYYFVVMPGGDPSQIIHEISGATTAFIDNNGKLNIETFGDTTRFDSPKAYQVTPALNPMPVNNVTWQNPANGTFEFNIPQYNPNLPLVIQIDKGEVPQINRDRSEKNLIWSTYWGGSGITGFGGVDNDGLGNTYYSGGAPASNFPLTQGLTPNVPYQGGNDALLLKINDLIEPQWATYFGGATPTSGSFYPSEGAGSISVYEDGSRIYISGNTTSSDITINNGGGAYYVDNQNNSGQDIFIAEFDVDGFLEWSTYFGDDGSDEVVNDIAAGKHDDLGNIGTSSGLYCVGIRGNTTPLVPMLDPNTHNETDGDGMILRFTTNNTLLWSNAWKCLSIESVTVDPPDASIGENVYFTGTTQDQSSSFPVVNPDPNIPQTHNNSGFRDAFVTSLNKYGEINYSFFYGGNCLEFATSIDIDENRNVYATGFSSKEANGPCVENTSTDLPVHNSFALPGATPYSPTSYLLKLAPYEEFSNNDVEILNAGYYGGGGEDKIYSITSRSDGYFFVTGKSNSDYFYGPPTIQFPQVNFNANFYIVDSPVNAPQSSSFIASFNSDFELVWTTYFGGRNTDIGNALSVSETDDRLYFAGTTSTNNAFIPPNSGGKLPIFEFDETIGSDDYIQYEPFGNADQPAWAAFFDISLIDSPFLSSEDINDDGEVISVYPNPFNSSVTIESPNNIEVVKVYDFSGRLVVNQNFNGKKKGNISLSDVEAGTYILSVQTDGEVFSKKIIKL